MTETTAPALTFLKLGGSLITDKDQASTARHDVIERLANEITAARLENPQLRLILGHGSGSFGHVAASKHGTRAGVHSNEEWAGFADVWLAASALNRIMVEAFHAVGLPALSFSALSAVTAANGQVKDWDITPIQQALDHGLVPLVYGDVVFDAQRGGTILSTEDLFAHLARQLHPQRILLAGLEAGVWADYPANTQLLEHITAANLPQWEAALQESASTDVTGGMSAKVREMVALLKEVPNCEARIFSGQDPGSVRAALAGESLGTALSAG